jgi:hypothetical protein
MHTITARKLLVGVAAVASLTLLSLGAANATEPPPGYPGSVEPLDLPGSNLPKTTPTGFVDPGPGAPSGPFGGGPRW